MITDTDELQAGPSVMGPELLETLESDTESDGGSCQTPLPVLMATNVPDSIFVDTEEKAKFEELFLHHTKDLKFHYLKSFHRVRVDFDSTSDVESVREAVDNTEIAGQVIRVFEGKVHHSGTTRLKPPKPQKLFLISPPSSPPVGWEPVVESDPVVDYTLQAAVASLTGAGESYELHPAADNHPSIVVVNPTDNPLLNTEEDDDSWLRGPKKMSIPQTSRPPIL